MVLEPFHATERQAEFMDRASPLKRVDAITFHSQSRNAGGGRCRRRGHGGYNTFCEFCPSKARAKSSRAPTPRLEQFIRHRAPPRLGLVSNLTTMAATIRP